MKFSLAAFVLALTSATALASAVPADAGVAKRAGSVTLVEVDLSALKRDLKEAALAKRAGRTSTLVEVDLSALKRDGSKRNRVDLSKRQGQVTGAVSDLLNNVLTTLVPTLQALGLTGVSDLLTEGKVSVKGLGADGSGVATVVIEGGGILEGVNIEVPVLAPSGDIAGPLKMVKAE
ncbi:hypothetical protein JCM6882_006522 [Rhodosporidiobolus microsporus]